MPLFSGRRWTLWFAVIAALLALNAGIFYGSNQSALDATRLVAQSRSVLIDIAAITAALDDAETGQRGYLLTDNDRYLRPYTGARASVDAAIAALRQRTASDPADRRYDTRIATLSAAKFEELRETIALQRAHQHAAALRLVLSNRGQQLMDQLRAAISALEAEENRVLARRITQAQDATQRERVTILLASLGDLLLLGLLGFVTRRALADRERVAEERRRLLERERAAREKAEAAVRMREEFLTVAAHELNTPLTALLGSAQLLEKRAQREHTCEARSERMLRLLVSQANRLALLVGTLLDTSRLQSDRLTLAPRQIDLVDLVRQVAQEMHAVSSRHPLLVEAWAEPIMLSGDALRLQQVLHNLIQNAIKYSPRGGAVRLRVEQEDDWARVSVSDQGIGIPAADLPHIFEQFFRASNTDARSITGIGMGLYVVHGIIGLHGGTITAQSTEGVGTTFTISLPRAPTALDARQADGGAGGEQAPAATTRAATSAPGMHR